MTNLSGLAFLVLVVAVIVASLCSPSQYWSFSVSAATLTILLVAATVAIVTSRDPKRRNFWIGFVIVGWGHYAATHGPWLRDEYGVPLRKILESIASSIYADELALEEFESYGPKTTNTVRILHNLWILSTASLGGVITCLCQGRIASYRVEEGGG